MFPVEPVALPPCFLLHGAHGCNRHPAFPAPSPQERDNYRKWARAHRAAALWMHACNCTFLQLSLRRHRRGAQAPIKPYPLRICGALRPNSLTKFEASGGPRIAAGDGYVKAFSTIRICARCQHAGGRQSPGRSRERHQASRHKTGRHQDGRYQSGGQLPARPERCSPRRQPLALPSRSRHQAPVLVCARRGRQDGKGRTCAARFIYAASNRAGRGGAAASAPAGHEPVGYECARRILVTAGQRRAGGRTVLAGFIALARLLARGRGEQRQACGRRHRTLAATRHRAGAATCSSCGRPGRGGLRISAGRPLPRRCCWWS